MEKTGCMGESIAMDERQDTMTMLPGAAPGTPSGGPVAEAQLGDGLAPDFDWKAFHHCVDEQLRSEPDHSVLALQRLCRAAGLTGRLQHEVCESTDSLDRARAARTLMRLREEVSPYALVELLDSEDPAVVVAVAEAIALSHETRLFVRVLRALCERVPGSAATINRLLLLFGEDSCPAVHGLLKNVLRQYIDAEDPTANHDIDPATEIDRHEALHLMAIVEVLARHGYRVAVPTFTRLLGVCDNDALHRCLAREVAAAGDAWSLPAAPKRLAA
jgi:hypothetical protein